MSKVTTLYTVQGGLPGCLPVFSWTYPDRESAHEAAVERIEEEAEFLKYDLTQAEDWKNDDFWVLDYSETHQEYVEVVESWLTYDTVTHYKGALAMWRGVQVVDDDRNIAQGADLDEAVEEYIRRFCDG